jgi:hypothetical protein
MAARHRLAPLFAALLAAAATESRACGHCVEDRVAAVYDYQVERQADRDHLRIAYVGVTGARAESPATADRVAAALRDAPAAAPDTIRTSASPAAASFAWRGNDAMLRDTLQAANRQLAASGIRLEVLRTWDARRGLH